MNELTIIAPQNIAEAISLSERLVKSQMVAKTFRDSPVDVLAIIMRGAELGLPPMTSLDALQIVNGKVTLKAETMTALCRRRSDVCKYIRLVKSDATECIAETHRVGDPDKTTMGFSMADAKAAELLGNATWKKYPAAMLRARCLSALCKAVYSDLMLGLYDPDEVENMAPVATLPEAKPLPKVAKMVDVTPVVTMKSNVAEVVNEARQALAEKVISGMEPEMAMRAMAPLETGGGFAEMKNIGMENAKAIVAKHLGAVESPSEPGSDAKEDAGFSHVANIILAAKNLRTTESPRKPGSDVENDTGFSRLADIIRAAKNLGELKTIRHKSNSKEWPEAIRAEWEIREGELRKVKP